MSNINKSFNNIAYFENGFKTVILPIQSGGEINKISEKGKKLIISCYPQNINKARKVINFFVNKGGRMCEINIITPNYNNKNKKIKSLVAEISAIRYDFMDRTIIRISGLPFCMFPDPESMFIKSSNPFFIKPIRCRKCKFNDECEGLPEYYKGTDNLSELHPLRLPEEVAVEVDSANLFLDKSAIIKLIRQAKQMEALIIRFIAIGSCFRSELYDLLKLAKKLGFITRLDISRFKIDNFFKFAKKISTLADYVIIGVDYKDIKDISKKDRQNEIHILKTAGVKTVRAITLATEQNVKNLEKIYNFVLLNKADKWAVNRDVYIAVESKKRIKILIDKLVEIKKDIIKNKYMLRVHMVYAIPFCFDDPIKINFVCTGAKSVDGHERILVRSDGSVVPIHYFDKKVGDYTNLESAWDHPFLKSIRVYKMLPKECSKCLFLQKCKGGSRACAYKALGSYAAADPLMDKVNIKKYGLNY